MPDSRSQLSARLQAELPFQQEQPAYARWLLDSYAPAAQRWHQENSPLHREPGLVSLTTTHYIANPQPFDYGTITVCAPPCGEFPGGNHDDLPLHPALLKKRLKHDGEQRILSSWHNHLQLPSPPPGLVTADYQQQSAMLHATRKVLLDYADQPDPAKLAAEIRGLFDPELLAEADHIFGRSLRLRHLRLLAERRDLLNAAFRLHPYGALLWISCYPSAFHGLASYWTRLNPHACQEPDSRYENLWQLPPPDQEPQALLDSVRDRRWTSRWPFPQQAAAARAAWEWTRGLHQPLLQQGDLPRQELIQNLYALFPAAPPHPELQKMLLKRRADKLLAIPPGSIDGGGLAGWLQRLERRLRQSAEPPAAVLKTLHLTIMALNNTRELAERVKQICADARRRQDPEILEAALNRELGGAGAAPKTAASHTIARVRRQERDTVDRLAQRLRSPALQKAFLEQLQPRPGAGGQTAGPCTPAGYLGRRERPLVNLYRRAIGKNEELSLAGPGLDADNSADLPLAWAHKDFLASQRYLAYGEFSRLKDLILKAATNALERAEDQAARRRRRNAAAAGPETEPPSARQLKAAAGQWLNSLSIVEVEKPYRQAAAAVGALIADHADPAALAALYRLLPPNAFESLRLRHYNMAHPAAAVFPEVADQTPALALWWLTNRHLPADWSRQSHRPMKERLENIVKTQFRRAGAGDWSDFQALPLDLLRHPAGPIAALTNQYDKRTEGLRRRMLTLSRLAAAAGPEGLPPDCRAVHSLALDYEKEDKTQNRERLLQFVALLTRHLRANPDRISVSSNSTPFTVRNAALKRFITAPDGLETGADLSGQSWEDLDAAARAWQRRQNEHAVVQRLKQAREEAAEPLRPWDTLEPDWPPPPAAPPETAGPEREWTRFPVSSVPELIQTQVDLNIGGRPNAIAAAAQIGEIRLFRLESKDKPPERALITLNRKEDGTYGLERIQAEQNHPPSLELQQAARELAAAYAVVVAAAAASAAAGGDKAQAAGKPAAAPPALT